MTLRIQIDTRALTKHLTDVERRQLPFAIAKGLNAVTLAAQQAQRAHDRSAFTVRRPEWMDRSIKVTQFATKANPMAELAVSPPGAPDRANILTKFEPGGIKTPRDGRSLMLPVDIRRNKSEVITRANRPRALLSGKRQNRVFLVRSAGLAPHGEHLPAGLYQRVGPKGRETLRLLYVPIPRAHIRPVLDFHATVRRTVEQRWAEAFAAALRAALSTAR